MNFEKTEINTAIAKAMSEAVIPAPADYIGSEDEGVRFIKWGEALIAGVPDMEESYRFLSGHCGKKMALVSVLQLMNSH